MFFLTGLLATSASADPPTPGKETQPPQPQLEMNLSAPKTGIQSVGSSTLQTVTPSELPVGFDFDICFVFFIQSPDAEFGDRVEVDLPDKWTVHSVAANSVPEANGCSWPPVSGTEAGNNLYWEKPYSSIPTGCGSWNGGYDGTLFNFCANVKIPVRAGAPWSLPWVVTGDGDGDPPHSSSGTYGPIGAVPPLLLNPDEINLHGCAFVELEARFSALNSTDVVMTVALDYTVIKGNGFCSGPASLTIPALTNEPFTVSYTTENLMRSDFVCEITAKDNTNPFNMDTSRINMSVSDCYWDHAGWQLEPNTGAIPNIWAAGVVGTHPGAAGPVGYVIGGLKDSTYAINPALQMYDPDKSEWTLLKAMSTAVYAPVAAWIDGLIYVAGGIDADFVATKDLQVYDPQTDTWYNSIPPDMPNPLGGGAGGVGTCSDKTGECLFHVGGVLDNALAGMTLDTWEYNSGTNSWTQLDDKPTGVSSDDGFFYGAGVGCGGKIYIGGNFNGDHGFFVLDATAETGSQWTTLANIPDAAGVMAPALVCDEAAQVIYLIGGDPHGLWYSYNNTVFSYDIVDDSWDSPLIQNMNFNKVGSVGWLMQNKLWSLGGGDSAYPRDPMPFESLERFYCQVDYPRYFPLIMK